MIEDAVHTILAAAPAVTALTGSRIHISTLPQGCAVPAISFQRLNTMRDYHHGGPVRAAEVVFAINCWSNTPRSAKALADAARGALNGYSGVVGSETIFASFIEDESEGPGVLEDDFRYILSLVVKYKET